MLLVKKPHCCSCKIAASSNSLVVQVNNSCCARGPCKPNSSTLADWLTGSRSITRYVATEFYPICTEVPWRALLGHQLAAIPQTANGAGPADDDYDDAETMVKLITMMVRHEGDKRIQPDDVHVVAASIRLVFSPIYHTTRHLSCTNVLFSVCVLCLDTERGLCVLCFELHDFRHHSYHTKLTVRVLSAMYCAVSGSKTEPTICVECTV